MTTITRGPDHEVAGSAVSNLASRGICRAAAHCQVVVPPLTHPLGQELTQLGFEAVAALPGLGAKRFDHPVLKLSTLATARNVREPTSPQGGR
jgi:hypothetical protein